MSGNSDENTIELTETEQEVMGVLVSRWELGRRKYGKGIAHESSTDPIAWMDEAIEEAADMLQYLVAMRRSFIERAKNEDGDPESSVDSGQDGRGEDVCRAMPEDPSGLRQLSIIPQQGTEDKPT